jgi:gluconolactonase
MRYLLALAGLALGMSAPAGEAIFAPGAKLKVEARGGAGGEGPAWHPKLGVLSSGNGHAYRLDPEGKSTIWRRNAGTNGLLFDHKGRLVACDSEHRRVVRFDDGKLTVLTDRYEGKRYNTPNDLTIDSKGRIYFSDPRYGSRKGMEMRDRKGRLVEGVYRIEKGGKVTRVLGRDEVDRPNGVLVSADDRYLYVADNNNDTVGAARKLWRFDLGKDGSVDRKSRKLIHDWGKGRGPDGLKQDVKGRLYVAAGLNKPNPPAEPAKDVKGGIYVLSPEGKRLAFLPVPTDEVTNCAFGGEDRKTLYITAGGTLYSIRTTTPGRLVWPRAK